MKLSDTLRELADLRTDIDSAVARQRGLDFEKLVRELFLKQGLLSSIKQSSYYTSDNRSEQIDGVINLEGKIFLLEAKWDSSLAASALYEFIGKIENKFFGTLGIFISYNSLSSNFINALRKGRKQNVIVIHGEDVIQLFEKDDILRDYLKYALEKLSLDDVSHVPVREFIEFSKVRTQSMEIVKGDEKITEFLKNNITGKEIKNSIELELAVQNLTSEERAKIYLLLFNNAPKFMRPSIPIKPSFSNFRTYFSIYKPQFTTKILKELPDDYFANRIFSEPKIYLLYFLDSFIDVFPTISHEAKTEFNKKICQLYKDVDYDGENALTKIIKRHERLIIKTTLKEIHKFYISYYYSSRENRFPQKAYAIELIKGKTIIKEAVFEWVEEQIKQDFEFYDDCKEINIEYYAKTYSDLGDAMNFTWNKWLNQLHKIFEKICP